jgi:outer membrane protein assembly factor BamB
MPVVDDNSVLYVAEHFARLQNKTTGVPVWTRTVGSNTDAKPWSTPAVGMVNVSGTPVKSILWATLKQKNAKGLLLSLNPATGAINWQKEYDLSFKSSPALANNVVYVGNDDTYMYAVNAATGNPIWSFKTGDIIMSSPWVDNGAVYFGSNDGKIYAIEEDVTSNTNINNVNFKIFPNPVTDKIMLDDEIDLDRYTIADITGKIVDERNVVVKNSIDVRTLSKGVYYIQFYKNNKLIFKNEFIKN